jgi:peptide/nickel transport system permease protein
MLSLGGVIVFVFLALAIVGPFVVSNAGREISRHRLMAPSLAHPFGTDHLGRDLFVMFIDGARVSIMVGVTATLVSFVIGVAVGACAGYAGGWLDSGLMRSTEIAMVIPRFFLAIIVVSFVGRSLGWVIFVIGGLGWMVIAQITRIQFLSLKTREFVEASRASGARTSRTIMRTLLPNAFPPILTYTTLQVATAMLLEAYLSFLGMGDPSLVSWGIQLRFAQDHLAAWWMAVFPGLGLLLMVLGTNLLGEGISEVTDPNRSARSLSLPQA